MEEELRDSVMCLIQEKEATSHDVIQFILHVDLITTGRNDDEFQPLLRFYMDCRSAFSSFENIQLALVHAVLRLLSNADTDDDRGVIQSMLAYCHVTIPSLGGTTDSVQLQLFLHVISLACRHGCPSQADAMLRWSVDLLAQVSSSSSEESLSWMSSIVAQVLSLFLLFPESSCSFRTTDIIGNDTHDNHTNPNPSVADIRRILASSSSKNNTIERAPFELIDRLAQAIFRIPRTLKHSMPLRFHFLRYYGSVLRRHRESSSSSHAFQHTLAFREDISSRLSHLMEVRGVLDFKMSHPGGRAPLFHISRGRAPNHLTFVC